LSKLSALGYAINYQLVDARDYGVPQERRRIIIVGYRKTLGKSFKFPLPTHTKHGIIALDGTRTQKWVTLKKAIGDLQEPIPALSKNKTNGELATPNNEYMTGTFSSMYMSRNRRKNWNDQSFTVQAGGRHAPLHPSSTEMVKIEEDKWEFKPNPVFRRLSVRECARVQTFPDNFIFYYKNIADGYKMIGNAVPVLLAQNIAVKIVSDLALSSGRKKLDRESEKAKKMGLELIRKNTQLI
jgi:DNA (cytosine-5)-methyltransferase 1